MRFRFDFLVLLALLGAGSALAFRTQHAQGADPQVLCHPLFPTLIRPGTRKGSVLYFNSRICESLRLNSNPAGPSTAWGVEFFQATNSRPISFNLTLLENGLSQPEVFSIENSYLFLTFQPEGAYLLRFSQPRQIHRGYWLWDPMQPEGAPKSLGDNLPQRFKIVCSD